MFARAGNRATILVLDYQPGLASYVEMLRANGDLEPHVDVVNLFDELAQAADSSIRKFNFARLTLSRRPFVAPKIVKDFKSTSGDEFEQDADGNIIRAKRYEDGRLIEDQYFSKKGRLYLRRVFSRGTASGVLVYDPAMGAFRRHATYGLWQTSWLSEFAKSHTDRPVFISEIAIKVAPILAQVDSRFAIRVGRAHTNHFRDPPYTLGSPVKAHYQKFLNRTGELDALVVLTAAQRRDIGLEFGNLEQIHVIPNVVDDFTPAVRAKDRSRLTIFARFTPGKRVDDAIRAFVMIKAAVPSAVLDIYGQGEREDEFQTLIDKLDMNEGVKLRGYTQDPHSEMTASIATLFPTDTEAFGNVIAESMLAGTPAISYDVNYGPAELIEDGVDGILVAHADAEAMALAAIELLQNPSRASEMGRRGREKIQKRCTERPVLKQWEELFRVIDQASK